MAPKRKPDTSKFTGRFAERITILREDAGLTVSEFAKALRAAGYSVKEPTIYSWEQGRSSPHIEAIPAIAKVLKTTPGDVLPPR